MNCNIAVLLITLIKYGDLCFKLAVFYNNCVLYDNVVTIYTYELLDISRVPVWLIELNKE